VRKAYLAATVMAGVAGVALWHAQSAPATAAAAGAKPKPAGPAADAVALPPESRRAFFGDLHLHTGYSFDAYALMGLNTEPEVAWRFGEGLPVEYNGQTVQRPRPLDFMAVTDHSEYLGTFKQMEAPGDPLAQTETGKAMRADPLKTALGGILKLMTPEGEAAIRSSMASAWATEVAAANRHYQPGRFTTFVAYEWTTMKDRKFNLHRNVIFRDAPPQAPFSAMDSERPEALWAWLETMRAKGIEALAIPHNANASGGYMFDWNDSDGKPMTAAYAKSRALNEPLTELFQHKGQSETSPLLSPTDEFADFERAEELLTMGPSKVDGSFARQALGRGMVIGNRLGANPFKLGFVSGTDFHNGLSNSDESAYAGAGLSSTDPRVNLPATAFAQKILSQDVNAHADPSVLMRDRGKEDVHLTAGKLNWSSGGLTGVWAEQNTRAAIYDALRRKETFATSGSELRLRMFAGWGFAPGLMRHADWVRTAYRTGVPMGGDLPARAAGASAPGFAVEAARDPLSGNLDRIQIVKLWLAKDANGADSYREKVFDVVWAGARRRDPRSGKVGPVGNTVDIATARYTNAIGAPVLSGMWRDPEFDPAVPAAYYARALEIPTPRWTTRLAAARHLPLAKGVPATLQERAVTSPVWYTPTK